MTAIFLFLGDPLGIMLYWMPFICKGCGFWKHGPVTCVKILYWYWSVFFFFTCLIWCVINRLRAESFSKKSVFSNIQIMPIWASNGIFGGVKRLVFLMKNKHFLRFSRIFNSQTVYYTYVNKKTPNRNVHIIYTLILLYFSGCTVYSFCHTCLASFPWQIPRRGGERSWKD